MEKSAKAAKATFDRRYLFGRENAPWDIALECGHFLLKKSQTPFPSSSCNSLYLLSHVARVRTSWLSVQEERVSEER